MPRSIALGLIVLILARMLHAQEPRPVPPASAPNAGMEAFVDGMATAFVRDKHLPGLTVGIVLNDRPALIKGYGLADVEDGRPVDGHDTLFRIGSISKTFIWTAAMMLVERGRLDLDADLNDYLMSVEIQAAFDAPVTMNHLMAHRAGFEDTLALFTVADEDPRSLSELLAAHQPRRVYPPGARTSYSNWGAALAAQVVEDVAGVAYQNFLEEEILRPLGMDSTTVGPPSRMPEALRARLATGYEFHDGAQATGAPMQIGAYWPAGGMASTAADMARWMRFHLRGGELDGVRLLRPETHARMWTRAFDDRPEAADLAHGFQSRPHRGVPTYGHDGATALFRSQMVLAPELGLGVFVAHNTREGGYSALSAMAGLLVERLSGDAAGAPATASATEEIPVAEYVGRYSNNRRSFTTFAAAFSAWESLVVRPAGNGALSVRGNDRTSRYRPLPGVPDVFEDDAGQRLMFQRDAEGGIVAVNDGSGVHSHERVGVLDASTTLVLAFTLAGLLSVSTLLGAWWRWRRPAVRTAAGLLAGRIAVLAAITMLALLAALIASIMAMADLGAADLPSYPPAVFLLVRALGWALVAMAAVALLALRPVWSGSGWSLWRRLHFSLFALALAFVGFQLWQWRIIAAPLI